MYACWITPGDDAPQKDAFYRFRGRMDGYGISAPWLAISAFSSYVLWVNGHLIAATQTPNIPGDATRLGYELGDLWNPDGENLIEVQLYVMGRNCLTAAVAPPALWVGLYTFRHLVLLEQTSEHWECALDPSYEHGNELFLTSQLGNCFFYHDNGKEPEWKKATLLDWDLAPTPQFDPQVQEFPERAPKAHVCQAGFLFRPKKFPKDFTLGTIVYRDYLQGQMADWNYVSPDCKDLADYRYGAPMDFTLDRANADRLPFTWPAAPISDGANGWFLIVDLGGETTGWLDLVVQTEKGAILDIAHGEHLTDGRIRCAIGDRNFVDRIYCERGGVLHFTHRLRRLGCRYLEMHITGCKETPRVGYLGLIPVERATPRPYPIHCEDQLVELLDKTAIRTLQCCQHEHFEDCPWREQGLYPYDSRNQALYGYPVWGNYDFVSACFKLLSKNWNKGAQTIKMTSPGDIHLSIPIFGLVLFPAAWELYLNSGEWKLLAPMLPCLKKILDCALKKTLQTPAGTLYHPGEDPEIWNFCEWQPGLDGTEADGKARHQAPYNLYLLEALHAAEKIAREGAKLHFPCFNEIPSELHSLSNALKKTCRELFWDEEKGLFRTNEDPTTPFHEHIQMLNVVNGVASPKQCVRIRQALYGKERPDFPIYESTSSALPYWVWGTRSLLPGKSADLLYNKILQNYRKGLLIGSNTLWETALGGEDFCYAGSLCHGWSALPAWYLRTQVLGITPASPGYATFHFQPSAPKALSSFEGYVKTPHGPIHARWQRLPNGTLHSEIVSCPKACRLIP